MKIEIEIPNKYSQTLDEVEEAEPTIHDQIEVEVLPQILRMINDAHRKVEQQSRNRLIQDSDDRPNG